MTIVGGANVHLLIRSKHRLVEVPSEKEKQASQFAACSTLNKPCTYSNGSPNDYERAATISQHARKTVAHRAEFVRTAIITMCYAKREVTKQENA